MFNASRYLFIALSASACGSVSDSDASLWTKTKDVGRAAFRIGDGGAPASGSGGEQPGAGGEPGAGTGGATMTGSGGASMPFGMGGTQPIGTGGIDPGMGGAAVGTGGSSGAGGASSGGATNTANPSKCTFSFSATTITSRGRYTPRNAGAIWITDANSRFVKTLSAWSPKEIGQVSPWVQSAGTTRPDVTTAATRPNHGPISATWDCTDVAHAPVADGKYTAHIAFAEGNALFGQVPPQASVDFVKSPAGADVSGQDTANFTSIHVTLSIP